MNVQRAREYSKVEWTGVQFSPDGKLMMITTAADLIMVADAYNLTLEYALHG